MKGWLVYSSLPAVLVCLKRLASELANLSAQRCLLVARLASEWIEAAKLSGRFHHRDLVCVYWVGRQAADRCLRERHRPSMLAISLLEHASPLDDVERPAVSGMIWHRRSLRFADARVVACVPKVDRARLNSLHGHAQQENAFAIGQLILRAGLWLSSRDESRTSDAKRDLDEAKGLLVYGTDRTRGYYHLMRHYYYRRLMAGRPRDLSLARSAVGEMRKVRRHYVRYLGTERHLHVAACDINLAELSSRAVSKSKLSEAVEVILAGPYDRSGVADLSGVIDGSSPIYNRIKYSQEFVRSRRVRQNGAYPTSSKTES